MIISELKKTFAKRVHRETGVEFNLTKREQNLVYPCFFCEFVGSETKSVAGIDYLNIYDFDLWYYSKTTNPTEIEQIISQLNDIKSFIYNDKLIIIENLDINIHDDLLIYKVRFLVKVDEIEEIEPTLSSIKLIKKELETITNCSVYYLNGNLKDLEKGFFIIEPSKTSTESNSINGCKDFEREIVLRYVTSNKKLDIYGNLEDITTKLIKKLKGKNGIYSINFELDISYNEEEFNNVKVINHELTLLYTEREKIMDIRVLMALQDSVGTAKTTDMIQAYATNFNVKAETNKIESKVLGAGRWVKDTISGRRSVGGDFELEPNIDQVELLLQACGFKNGGADKTYKPSPFEKYLTLISDFPTDNLHIEYKDCLINTFGISVTQEGYVSTKVGIIGLSDQLQDSKKTNGIKTDANKGAQLVCYGAKLSQSNTSGAETKDISANVESVEITINNSLEGRGGLNSKHFTKILQSGRASIDVVVKFNAFEKDNYKKALEMLKNNTALKLDLELSEDISDPKKGRKIEISLPNVKLASVDIDDIEGIGGLTRNMVALPKADGGDPITFKIVEATSPGK